MNRWLGWLTASCVLILVGSYAWTHRAHMADVVASPSAQTAAPEGTYAEAREAQQAVTMTGPMANYMARQKPSNVETLQPTNYKPVASDHVGGSPVGTSSAILHQTFGVAGIVNLPFEVPAHASNPQLRGAYRSFLKQASAESNDVDVEFLLLSEQQYGEFLNGRPSESVFSAEDAHNQEVNTGLPPTRDQPAKYYLVFRNNRHEPGKMVVQADFRIDF
jgi:hypothetical protein